MRFYNQPSPGFLDRTSFAVTLAGLLLLSGCGGSTGSSNESAGNPPAAVPAMGVAVGQAFQIHTPVPQQIVAADNTFGLALFNALTQGATSNVAISPTSIALALEMIYNGAAGSTQQSMSQVLQLQGLDALTVGQDNAALQAALINPDPNVQLTTANSLWMPMGNSLVLPSFASTNATYYAADVGDSSGAPDNVNAWVATATNGLITKILPPGDYSHVIAILADAIYFKGVWTSAFDTSQTMATPFTLADGTPVSCEMMNQTGSFPYLAGPNFQAVELPYGKTGRFSMLIILPAAGVDLGGFVANMTGDELNTWIAGLKSAEISIGLPRFTASYAHSLVNALTSLGMGVAFTPNSADFANLASGPIYISDVEHATVVQVDESGTVAAGATEGTVTITVAPPSMTMDRPFFYAIVDGQTGALVFIGTLADPTQSSSGVAQ